jgi:tRNA modification GTPase
MLGKLTGWDDTIVALATPPGIGAIAVIRLSGKKSLEIVNELFPSRDLTQQPTHSLHVGYLKEEENILDEVVVSIFRSPKSYTGEDVVEVSTHGSPYVQEKIIEAFIRKGARMAKAGEFTQRAFLNGKLDLTQAEAVADLIASNAEASRKSALHTLRGGFSHDLQQLREKLLSFSALIELELDFSQEDVEFADRKQFYELIDNAEKMTNNLLQSFKLGNVIKNGVQAAIVGRPNAGKSTLLNALLNENRAIVSEIAGTTRDTIEEVINIDGILFRLIDTAGIRQHTSDDIESMGMKRSMEKIEAADIVIVLYDASDGPWTMDDGPWNMDNGQWSTVYGPSSKFILVANKADLLSSASSVRKKIAEDKEVIFISAKENQGIDELRKAMTARVLQGAVQTEGTIITNARHYQSLQQVELSLRDIRKGLDERLPGDLLTPDIRRCLHYLGEITGEVTTEEQLGYIFGKFCIGK